MTYQPFDSGALFIPACERWKKMQHRLRSQNTWETCNGYISSRLTVDHQQQFCIISGCQLKACRKIGF